MMRIFAVLLCMSLSFSTAFAKQKPSDADHGAPHTWAPAAKQAIGSAFEARGAQSPVWFTVQSGILTEVFYPSIDQAQIGDLQLIVTDGAGFFSEQKRDVVSQVQMDREGMSVHISGKEISGAYQIEQDIITEPQHSAVRIRTVFIPLKPGLRAFVLFKPAISNTGSGDSGSIRGDAMTATEGSNLAPVHAAVLASTGWRVNSAGYVGVSDGWQDLSKHFQITEPAQSVGPGNIALTGELAADLTRMTQFEITLGFGATESQAIQSARDSMSIPFQASLQDYRAGWNRYLDGLGLKGHQRLSAAVIKMHEDKTQRGAIIASMTTPAIPGGTRAPESNQGGYHLVWPRDLYHAAIGLLSAGDIQTPTDVLRFLRERQKPDGSWHQNFFLDGTPYWHAIQMDQVSFPILLASMLKRSGVELTSQDLYMVRKAADYISANGPVTEQDRWEEIGGYIPSTIAAEIAALRVASRLLGDNQYYQKAWSWSQQIENWTVVREGSLGKNYYLRVSRSGNTQTPERIDLANEGGLAWNWDIMDGGFLELVRLGIRDWNSPEIVSTLAMYDRATPDLELRGVYRRYNRDAYGSSRIGGYWPVLAGERGEYAIASGQLTQARYQLATMESSGNETGLIPEQIIGFSQGHSVIGEGVPCPLVWSHAEHLRLSRSIRDGKIFDQP